MLRRTLFEALPVLGFGVLLTDCASVLKKRPIDIMSAPGHAGGQIVSFADTGRQAINTPDTGRLVGDTKTATWQDVSIINSADNKVILTILSSQMLVLFRAVGDSGYRSYQGYSLTTTGRGWYSNRGLPWSATLLDARRRPIDRWSDASPVAVTCLEKPNFWRRAINPALFDLTRFAYVSYTGDILFHQC